MPRLRVIVLNQEDAQTFRYALWADVPAARQSFYARPAGTVSQWSGALSADNANLVSGAVVEHVDKVVFPVGVTLAQAEAALQAIWTSFQTSITNTNSWSFYGTTWDGTTWTIAGAA